MWLTRWCELSEEGRAMRYPRGLPSPGSSFVLGIPPRGKKASTHQVIPAIFLFTQRNPFYKPLHGDEQHSHYLACREHVSIRSVSRCSNSDIVQMHRSCDCASSIVIRMASNEQRSEEHCWRDDSLARGALIPFTALGTPRLLSMVLSECCRSTHHMPLGAHIPL
jgi:hypothetical protein